MPFESEKQRRFFEGCRKNPKNPKCPPPHVVAKFFVDEAKSEQRKTSARRKAFTDRRKG